MRLLERFAFGLVFAVLAVGLALVPLELPWFAHELSARFSQAPPAIAAPLAEASRAFVIQGDRGAKATLSAVMPADAISHLADVNRVIMGGNRLTALLFVVAVLWMLLRHRYPGQIAGALRIGAAVILLVLGVLVVVAMVSFDTFFAAFHSVFFKAGTWTFPADSMLIRLFPEPFWAVAGGVWAGLIVVIAVLYLLVSWVIDRG